MDQCELSQEINAISRGMAEDQPDGRGQGGNRGWQSLEPIDEVRALLPEGCATEGVQLIVNIAPTGSASGAQPCPWTVPSSLSRVDS